MRWKDAAFYCGTVAVLVLVYFVLLPESSVQRAQADYFEECRQEGCSNHEVEELCESYQEECRHEGCSPEEVQELIGPAGGDCFNTRSQLLSHFQRIGCSVVQDDFGPVCPECTGTTETWYGPIAVCNDNCTYADGSKSSSYVCGFFVSWTFVW